MFERLKVVNARSRTAGRDYLHGWMELDTKSYRSLD